VAGPEFLPPAGVGEFCLALRLERLSPEERDRLTWLFDRLCPLPPSPQAVSTVVEHVTSSQAQVEEVAHLADAPLGLCLMNEASARLAGRPVRSVLDAVKILGLTNIEAAARKALAAGGQLPSSGNPRGHWLYSRLAGVVAAILGRATAEEKMDQLHTAGMLLHLGKLVMAQCLPEESARVQALRREKAGPSWEAEREVLGLDHGQIGAAAAFAWAAPAIICQAIWHHHQAQPAQRDRNWEFSAIVAAAARVTDAVALPEEKVLARLFVQRRRMALALHHGVPEPAEIWADPDDWAGLFQQRLETAEKRLGQSLIRAFGARGS